MGLGFHGINRLKHPFRCAPVKSVQSEILFSYAELAEDLSQQVFCVKLASDFSHGIEGSAQLDRDKFRGFPFLQTSPACSQELLSILKTSLMSCVDRDSDI